MAGRPLDWRWFIFGCVFTAVALFLVIWAFSLPELKQHQYFLLRWALPITSGFACGCFTGSIKATGPVGKIVITATGGFAVWLLTYFLLPKPTPEVTLGKDAVAFGRVSGHVGDRSVVVGATDDRGNTIITNTAAIGHNAQAGPGSIAIGAGAKAGVQIQAGGNITIYNAALEDFVPGTSFKFSELTNIFPFGYGVIFCSDSEPFKYQEFRDTNRLLNWSIDWTNIYINRDIAAETVHFKIPSQADGVNFHMSSPTNGGFSTLNIHTKLKAGFMATGPIYVRNQPVLHVAMLSENQRRPVFAVGYRIITDEQDGGKKPGR